MSLTLDDPEDRTVACAEYVLGTLDGADRDAFTTALARDPALQAEVGYWQDRLLGLASRVPAVTPSPQLWQRIEAKLGMAAAAAMSPAATATPTAAATPTQHAAATPTQHAAATAPSPTPFTPPRIEPRRAPAPALSLWERLGFWRFVSGVAVAASVLLATMLWQRPPATEVRYVAVLQSPDQQRAGWVVHASDRGPVRLIPLAPPGQVPTGHSWQFWTKGKDATGPTSLGLVPADGRVEVPRDRLPDLGDQQLFEITLEPPSGSPIGRPTGPILYVGRASAI